MTTIQIEEGKFYTANNGETFGPMQPRVDPGGFVWKHEWDGQKCRIFKTDGTAYSGPHRDLIAEVPAPAKSISEAMQELHEVEAADIKTYIADEAKRIVTGARRGAYGKPEDNFARIARYWDAYFKNTGRAIDVTAADVSPLMRLMKEARLNETPDHLDSHVDLIGYSLTGAEVAGVKRSA